MMWSAALLVLTASAAGPVEALVGTDGQIHLSRGRRELCSLSAGLYDRNWGGASASGGRTPRTFRIAVPSGGSVAGTGAFTEDPKGALRAEYTFTPESDLALQCLHVTAEFEIPALAGGQWTADGESGIFPAEFKEIGLFNGAVRSLKLELPQGGAVLDFSFADPTPVLLQDNRRWGPSFSVRIHRNAPPGGVFKGGQPVRIGFSLSSPEGLSVALDDPVTLTAGPEWIPLNLELEIEPGSALDFSGMGFAEAPAGKYGWVRASPAGHFYFENDPQRRPRRFYGVNLCFSAQYIAREQAERLAERLVRLGYNTVRIHHYEGELCQGQKNSYDLNPEKLDQFDGLLAAFIKKGLYVTTDLFVSRPVPRSELGLGGGGRVEMNEFKYLVPAHEKAFENFKAFARNLLSHVNPYTGRSYAQEPGLAWIALINEGNLGNFYGSLRNVPEWKAAWNRWLAGRYRDRSGLAGAWGGELKEGEDPGAGSVGMPSGLDGRSARGRDAVQFLSHMERDFYRRAADFLRRELGVKALLTNMSCWTNHATDQLARAEFDFVDDHFYVDHPHFLEQPWRLPSRCPNTSPVAAGAPGGRSCAFTRLLGKPFTITEYNYSAPGRFRGVGGILTGALGAIQDWSGIWRFCYSHSRDALFTPSRMNYFDMATDPLGQAAERASLCLFLRRDIEEGGIPHVTVAFREETLGAMDRPVPRLAPSWHWVAWIAGVSTAVRKGGRGDLPWAAALAGKGRPLPSPEALGSFAPVATDRDAYGVKSEDLMKVLKPYLGEKNLTDPARNVYQSPGGSVTIDGPSDMLVLDTARTAGGYAPAGGRIVTRSGVEVRVEGADATVWASSLDGRPLVESRRILVTHLTDCQNTGIRYAEQARRTLLDWGRMPHLVRAGRAEVRLKVGGVGLKVWALSTSGRRLGEVPSRVEGGWLMFTADVGGGAGGRTAVLCYEVSG